MVVFNNYLRIFIIQIDLYSVICIIDTDITTDQTLIRVEFYAIVTVEVALVIFKKNIRNYSPLGSIYPVKRSSRKIKLRLGYFEKPFPALLGSFVDT